MLCHGTSLGPASCFYIRLRNCYVARFGHPLKPSKPSQQLSKALERQNPPQQLSKASRLLCHGTGPRKLFLLLRTATWQIFGHLLKPSKPSQQLSKALERQNPPQQLSKASHLLCHGTPLGSTSWLRNCHVARFGHPLKPSKPLQQLSKALERQNPPQQLSKASRLLCSMVPP